MFIMSMGNMKHLVETAGQGSLINKIEEIYKMGHLHTTNTCKGITVLNVLESGRLDNNTLA